MKIKKLDNYTVRCVLTEDDMIENDITLEDFFSDREKIHDLMETIIDKARDEVGYEIKDEILSMQIMPLPKNGLAITISGKQDNQMKDLIGNVKDFASMIAQTDNDQMNEEDDIEKMESLDNLEESVEKNEKPAKAKSKNTLETVQDKPEDKNKINIFCFKSLSEVEGYCKTMQSPKYVTSHLYKDSVTSCYYLVMEKGRLKVKTFQKACEAAMEFSDFISCEPSRMFHMKEHCELLISRNAIATMRKIASAN